MSNNTESNSTGILLVKLSDEQEWGTVCDRWSYFTETTANVICRWMGFNTAVYWPTLQQHGGDYRYYY